MTISLNTTSSSQSPESLSQYTLEKLRPLIKRICDNIFTSRWWEWDLIASPHHFLEDSKYHFSPSKTRMCIEKNKKKLIEDANLLGEILNTCGRQLGSINYLNKERLTTIVTYLSKGSIPFTELESACGLNRIFERLIQPIIETKPSVTFKNLVPSSFYGTNKKSVRKTTKVDEVLDPEQQSIKNTICSFLQNRQTPLSSMEKSILNFLEGIGTIDDVGLTKENARSYLTVIKIIDLTIAEHKAKMFCVRSSDELRTKILELCSPSMTTSEVYTKTVDVRKIKDRMFLSDPGHWTAERVGRQAKTVANQMILAASLSKRLNHYKPSIWAVRANTAGGKTRAIAEDSCFHQAIDEEGEMSGTLNPDILKYSLRKRCHTDKETFIINNQVHKEGTALFLSLLKGLKKNAAHASLLIEGRLSTIEEVDTNILKFAKKRDGEVLLLDIASPLIVSINRVLTRDPSGLDPCPPLSDIVKGYKESIIYRKRLIDIVKKDSSIRYFKLYFNDDKGKTHLVAEKEHDTFKVFSEELLEASCTLPSDEEILRQINQVITSESIEEAIQRGDIPEKHRHLLEHWKGISISKAVDMHGIGIPVPMALELIKEEARWREKYGTIRIEPFTAEWLQDFPHLIDHLESEHLLHIRGVDEDGRGLHWQTNKFSWNLNPQFNPEAKGGFQMKLGYFIVPSKKIEKFASLSLSPKVLQELEVKNPEGELIGYRFFVHPEAYEHFKSLHDASITFVKPEQSEFIATPTSSYRSLVVRRILRQDNQDTIPFIVKLGVSSSSTDTSKLLPKVHVEKSIQFQTTLEKMEKKADLLFFPENLGLVLKDIPSYPPCATIDSGMIIREFPQDFLEGRCKIFSFSALMSVERTKKENQGVCYEDSLKSLPLIYEVIYAAVKKGVVKTSEEFIHVFLIQGYLKAIEHLHFKEGFPFSPHGQNLCMVLNQDNTPRGFAYRDLEGMSSDKEKGYIETFSWFYRYHVFIKLLNVIHRAGSLCLAPPLGAPTQIGYRKKLRERDLNYYISNKIKSPANIYNKTLQVFFELSLTFIQYQHAIKQLDEAYLSLLFRYFDVKKAGIVTQDGCLPAAESGSAGEHVLTQLNARLWKHRYTVVPRPIEERRKESRKMAILDGEILRPLGNEILLSLKRSAQIKEIQEWHATLLYQEAMERERKAWGSIHTFHDLKSHYKYECGPFKQIPDKFLSDLMRAVKYGNCHTIQSLLSQSSDRNQRSFQDALCVAAIMGRVDVIKLMCEMGVDPNFKHPFNCIQDAWIERLRPLGHAIEHRQIEVVDFLLNNGCEVDAVLHGEEKLGAIDLFFHFCSSKEPNPKLLSLLLSKHPILQSLNKRTIFNIAVYANAAELKLLLEAGLDAKTIWREERNPQLKGNKTVGYSSEANLLDLAVIQAERANFFQEDNDAIEKVRLLIENGADPKKCNNFCNQNYLHKVTHPKLVQLFCQSKVDVSAQARAGDYLKYQIRPIDLACRLGVIDLLCERGENCENAPYLKGTKAHQEALQRIGPIDASTFIKAVKSEDIPAVVALIGEGVDVNQRTNKGTRWTALHWLFSDINHGSVSEEYDYVNYAEDINLRLINLLIKNGAKPLKDDVGRTPLMCMTFHPFSPGYIRPIIDYYIDFEALYYGLNPKEYREKFHKLREGGYQSVDFISTPIETRFNEFWQSFENHSFFSPKESHHPVAEWYKMLAYFGD